MNGHTKVGFLAIRVNWCSTQVQLIFRLASSYVSRTSGTFKAENGLIYTIKVYTSLNVSDVFKFDNNRM